MLEENAAQGRAGGGGRDDDGAPGAEGSAVLLWRYAALDDGDFGGDVRGPYEPADEHDHQGGGQHVHGQQGEERNPPQQGACRVDHAGPKPGKGGNHQQAQQRPAPSADHIAP